MQINETLGRPLLDLLHPLFDQAHLFEGGPNESHSGHQTTEPEEDLEHTQNTHSGEETNQTACKSRYIHGLQCVRCFKLTQIGQGSSEGHTDVLLDGGHVSGRLLDFDVDGLAELVFAVVDQRGGIVRVLLLKAVGDPRVLRHAEHV